MKLYHGSNVPVNVPDLKHSKPYRILDVVSISFLLIAVMTASNLYMTTT